jgi:hypothetical protein
VALSFGCIAASQLCHTAYCYTLLMWGRVILGTVIVTLTILWLVAIWVLLLDPRTFLQKWQGGLWNSKIDGEFIGVYLVSQRLCFSGRRRVAGGPSTHAHNKMCDDDHIWFTESALVVRGEDGGCYAQALCIAIVGVLLIAALIDVVAAGVKASVVRSYFYSAPPVDRDSRACEHEKLYDGAVAAVICCLT